MVMSGTSALSEARSTCDGLHRLIKKIGDAAVDVEGGSSSYEMLALIASANTCVINLETQLTIVEASAVDSPNVVPLKRDNPSDEMQHIDNTELKQAGSRK